MEAAFAVARDSESAAEELLVDNEWKLVEVERLEGHDADDDLGRESVAPIRLVPHDPQAAPIVVCIRKIRHRYRYYAVR